MFYRRLADSAARARDCDHLAIDSRHSSISSFVNIGVQEQNARRFGCFDAWEPVFKYRTRCRTAPNSLGPREVTMLSEHPFVHWFIVVRVTQLRSPTIEARRDNSIQFPSGSRVIDIRATSPSVTMAKPSRTPLLCSSPWPTS